MMGNLLIAAFLGLILLVPTLKFIALVKMIRRNREARRAEPKVGDPLDHESRRKYTTAKWLGIVFGVGLSGLAVYHYFLFTAFENKGGGLRVWEVFASMYSVAGKWGVMGLDVLFAGIFFAVSYNAFQLLKNDPSQIVADAQADAAEQAETDE